MNKRNDVRNTDDEITKLSKEILAIMPVSIQGAAFAFNTASDDFRIVEDYEDAHFAPRSHYINVIGLHKDHHERIFRYLTRNIAAQIVDKTQELERMILARDPKPRSSTLDIVRSFGRYGKKHSKPQNERSRLFWNLFDRVSAEYKETLAIMLNNEQYEDHDTTHCLLECVERTDALVRAQMNFKPKDLDDLTA